MEHFFSVDVEEFFHAHVFDRLVPRHQWEGQPSRVEAATGTLLELLARHGATGTFFTLGWVAQRQPGLVRRIAAAGHELASHSWWHPKISDLSPLEFREEVRASKSILEDLAGRPVTGFRAPSFSIRPGMEWAFDVLLEEGYTWDSSLFPIRRPGYGYPGALPVPHHIERPAGRLLEIPPATLPLLGLRLPAAGGGYLRQFPFGIIQAAFRSAERAGVPAMFYIHPWDIDAGQPRLPLPLVRRVRHYRGIAGALPRIDRLLAEFRFTSVAAWQARGAA